MLNLSNTMLDFLLNRKESQSVCRIILDDTATEPKTGVDAVEHDLTEFATSLGSISKELQLQDGIYRPGSHSFDLANTKDAGDFLFTLRKNVALNTWVNKSYRLLYGFRNDSAVEELIVLYRGIIQGKSEDRINDTVSIRSNDALKYLNDYKFCSLHSFNSQLNTRGFTDNRSVQPIIKYGVFNLIDNKDVFALAEGLGSNAISALGYAPNYVWLFPIVNKTLITNLYFWDYKASTWGLIPASIYTITSPSYGNYQDSQFSGTADLIPATTSKWSDYIAGTNYFSGSTPELKVAASLDSSGSSYSTQNPISIALDLLKLSGVATANIDVSAIPISSPSLTRTFDYSWQRFQDEGIKINVDYANQVSPLEVIQQIGKLCAFAVFQSADYSTSQRRNLKVAIDRFLNPCKDAPPNLQLSTNDNIVSMTMEQNSDELYSGASVVNFEPGLSTKESFDVIVAGSASDLLNGTNINQRGDSSVYLYNNHVQAIALAQRLYNEFISPVERYSIELDKMAVILEIGDYFEIFDNKIQETIIARVNNHNFDCLNRASLVLKRFGRLYGPDQTNITFKVWAFCDCAHAGTNQQGGVGADASMTTGTNVITLNDGNTTAMVVGMVFRIGGTTGGVSGSEYFIIASITDSTHLTTATNASATHTNESWSAGKGYFAR